MRPNDLILHFIHSHPYRRELKQSVWGHGLLLAGICLFTLISPQRTFRHDKFFTVNLRSLGPSGVSMAPAKPAQVIAPVQKPASKPQVQKPVPKTPAPQKVQKLTPKPTPLRKVTTQPQKQTPSLSQRLKNRLAEVKNVQTTQKFHEPEQAAVSSKYHFVEPEEWSKAQTLRAGAQTTMSASGSGGGPGKEFPFAWYLELIQNKITLNWKEPPKPLIKERDLSAMVSFVISRDGQIQKITLEGRSGLESLDQSVVEAVRFSNPLPPLPENFSGRHLNVKIKFELTQ